MTKGLFDTGKAVFPGFNWNWFQIRRFYWNRIETSFAKLSKPTWGTVSSQNLKL